MHILASKKGFTLAEVAVAAGVFLIAIVGVLYSYLKCMELEEIGRNSSIALSAAKNKMEDIKNTAFANIFANYNNTTFNAAGITNGKGVVYVDNTDPTLIKITIVFCWKQLNGRLIGEDKNLNGVLNAGEDSNGNGQLDSPVKIMSYIYG